MELQKVSEALKAKVDNLELQKVSEALRSKVVKSAWLGNMGQKKKKINKNGRDVSHLNKNIREYSGI